jgi:hypothetical protein
MFFFNILARLITRDTDEIFKIEYTGREYTVQDLFTNTPGQQLVIHKANKREAVN